MSDQITATITLESVAETTPIVRVSEVETTPIVFTVRVLVDDEPEG